MIQNIISLWEVTAPALVIGAFLGLVGLAVRVALTTLVRMPASLGVTMALGASVVAVTGTSLPFRGQRGGADSTPDSHCPCGPPLVHRAILAGYQRDSRLACRSSTRRTTVGLASRLDGVAIVAALAVLLPLIAWGLTFWTALSNDFPNYAASGQIWSGAGQGAAAFEGKHPDAFGEFQRERAGFEKPMVTALVVVSSRLTGLAPYQLLTPLMLVFLVTLISTLFALSVRLFRLGPAATALAVVVPTFSIIPMSRIFDAQLGQVVAVALLATLVVVAATSRTRATPVAQACLVALIALVASAALGSNATLVVGSAITVTAVGVWVIVRSGVSVRRRLPLVLAGLAASILVSLPLLPWYRRSFGIQSTGGEGTPVPFASPLAAIGQQVSLDAALPLAQALLSWTLALLVLAALIWGRSTHAPRGRAVNTLVLTAIVANGALIGLRLGWDNYATHKWLALFIALAMPVFFTAAVARWGWVFGRARLPLLAALALSSFLIALSAAVSVAHVMPRDLMNLAADERLTGLDPVNLRLGSSYENSLGALLVPATSVVVTEQTYADPTKASGDVFLLRRDAADAGDWDLTELNETYAIGKSRRPLESSRLVFNSMTPSSRQYLSGPWGAAEESGTWSSEESSVVTFNLPSDFPPGAVDIAVTSSVFATDSHPQSLAVVVNGKELLTETFVQFGAGDTVIHDSRGTHRRHDRPRGDGVPNRNPDSPLRRGGRSAPDVLPFKPRRRPRPRMGSMIELEPPSGPVPMQAERPQSQRRCG